MIQRVIEHPNWIPYACLSLVFAFGLPILWLVLKETFRYFFGGQLSGVLDPRFGSKMPPPPPKGHWIKLESVWHSVKDRPKSDNNILIEHMDGHTVGWYGNAYYNEEGERINHVVSWAYIEDLILKDE